MLRIQVSLNATPYHSMSLISPESILNPRSQVANFIIPQDGESTHQEHMKNLGNRLQEIHISHLEEMDRLQMDAQNLRDPEIGQVIWILKNPDIKHSGIFFGQIKKRCSNYLVSV